MINTIKVSKLTVFGLLTNFALKVSLKKVSISHLNGMPVLIHIIL